MITKKREIYTRVSKINEIIDLMEEMKENQRILQNLYKQYDSLNLAENHIFENWSNYIEDTENKLEHITL